MKIRFSRRIFFYSFHKKLLINTCRDYLVLGTQKCNFELHFSLLQIMFKFAKFLSLIIFLSTRESQHGGASMVTAALSTDNHHPSDGRECSTKLPGIVGIRTGPGSEWRCLCRDERHAEEVCQRRLLCMCNKVVTRLLNQEIHKLKSEPDLMESVSLKKLVLEKSQLDCTWMT